jgi:hypothetical protein
MRSVQADKDGHLLSAGVHGDAGDGDNVTDPARLDGSATDADGYAVTPIRHVT